MIEASCHCGSVRLEIDQVPTEITDCTCSICRRYGTLWAYYDPKQVRIHARDGTQTYAWGDRTLAFHRCPSCGCVTHWAGLDSSRDRMGVNARLMDMDVRSRARLRHLDGAWTERYLD